MFLNLLRFLKTPVHSIFSGMADSLILSDSSIFSDFSKLRFNILRCSSILRVQDPIRVSVSEEEAGDELVWMATNGPRLRRCVVAFRSRLRADWIRAELLLAEGSGSTGCYVRLSAKDEGGLLFGPIETDRTRLRFRRYCCELELLPGRDERVGVVVSAARNESFDDDLQGKRKRRKKTKKKGTRLLVAFAVHKNGSEARSRTTDIPNTSYPITWIFRQQLV